MYVDWSKDDEEMSNVNACEANNGATLTKLIAAFKQPGSACFECKLKVS
jgi:hypothetical protein